MAPSIDLTGRRFGKLTVQSVSHRTPDRKWCWHCLCDCGERATPSGRNLKSGKTKSCGCVHGIHISIPVTRDELFSILHYDSETGIWRWLVEGRGYLPGDIAGSIRKGTGYVRIYLRYRSYLAHQLAWFYMTGTWTELLDHKDTNPLNNSWKNLRKATPTQNLGNARRMSRNTSGLKGVSFRRGKFRVTCSGKDVGTFASAEEAARAYDAEAVKQFGEFARTNFGMQS